MKIVNLPTPRPRSDYSKAVTGLKEWAAAQEAVRSVYLAGTVKQPGISDLDVLVSLNERSSRPIDLEATLPAKTAELIGRGSLLKVPNRSLKDISIIDDFPLRLIWGEKATFASYHQRIWEVCRVLDWLPERLYTVHRARLGPTLDAVWALQLLKSVTVSLRKLSGLTKTKQYQSFVRDVMKTREQWWTKSFGRRELRRLLARVEVVMIGALNDTAQYLDRENFIPVERSVPRGAALVIAGGPRFSFGDTLQIRKRDIVLPPTYMIWQAAQMELSSGWLKKKLSESWRGNRPGEAAALLAPELASAVELRMKYVNEVGTFLRQRGIKRGLVKYGWFLETAT